jgi:hypothetical protein
MKVAGPLREVLCEARVFLTTSFTAHPWFYGASVVLRRIREGWILPDLPIGAHTEAPATRPLSRDRGFYGRSFPSLKVLDPARES